MSRQAPKPYVAERPPEAVFEAARAIARAMAMEVLENERKAAQRPPMPNPER